MLQQGLKEPSTAGVVADHPGRCRPADEMQVHTAGVSKGFHREVWQVKCDDAAVKGAVPVSWLFSQSAAHLALVPALRIAVAVAHQNRVDHLLSHNAAELLRVHVVGH